MDLQSVNFKQFIESLDLTSGLFRVMRVDTTSNPNILIVHSNMMVMESMPKEIVAQLEDPDMAMAMWVMWVPEQRLMRFSCNLDLGSDSIDNERLSTLIEIANYLNFASLMRIAKAFVHADDEEKNIGTAAFTLSIPPNVFETQESTEVLKNIVSENMARLYGESAAIAVELHAALESALSEDSEEVDK